MHIQVLGDVRLGDAAADQAVGRGQARELLALLVTNRGVPLDTDAIVESLWDETPPATARTIVHGAVARLRRAIGPDALALTDAGYQLAGDLDVDLWAVQDLAAAGRIAEARARATAPVLGRYHDRPWSRALVAELAGALGRPTDPVTAADRLRPSPAPLTRLIGRRRELGVVREAVSRARLVTLVGLGGIGKSRLAAEIVVELSAADGVRMVHADVGQASGSFADRLAAELGVAMLSASDGLAASASVLAGPPTLLLLEGCEHDLEGAADAATFLLGRCPSLRILATSRFALGVTGEHVVPILPFADPADPLGDAAELLLDRIRALGMPVDHADRALAAAICERCAGVPLAIEMASSLLLGRSLSVGDPSTGWTPAHPAAAVADAIDAALEALSPAAAAGARSASLLPAGTSTVLLDELTTTSGALVARELLAAGVATTEGTGQSRRLRFPDPVREQLVSRSTAADVELVAQHLAALAERCRDDVLGVIDLRALADSVAELANAAAVLHALANHRSHRTRLRLALAFAVPWREDGHWNAGADLLSSALADAERDAPLDPVERAEATWAIATVGGTFELAARMADELAAAADAAAAAERWELAVALRVREANGRGYAGDLAAAVQAVAAARLAAERSSSPFALPYVDALDAAGRMMAGEPEQASSDFAALGQLAADLGAFSEAARAHRLASIAARTAGDLDRAVEFAEIAEELAIRGMARGTLAVVRGELAELRFAVDPATARPALVAALETGSAAGEVRLAGVSRLRLGLLDSDRAAIATAALELLSIDGRWASLALAHLLPRVPPTHRLRRLVPLALEHLEWGAPLAPVDQALVAAATRTETPTVLPATWHEELVDLLVHL